MTPEEPVRDWTIRGIHHVAFATEERGPIDALAALLDLRCGEPEEGPGFLEWMAPTGSHGALQLLQATGAGTVRRFLDRRGPALHHVALEVDDLERALRDLAWRNAPLLDERPRAGGNGTRIAFLQPIAFGGMLVELVELVEPTREVG